ncbi:MAG: diaminopimelate decarboxylase [Candidatus Aureabacteria bacterium]|nr:diaminopimelate decarboxylase [Candidatus Auribacterota bacterium]
MHEFRYKRGSLCCEGVSLESIAQRFGTPAYVYSHAALMDGYESLDKAFAPLPHLICYSVKSNSNLAVLRAMAKSGSGFDIVSGGELRRVLRAGASPRKIVFAGVGKTEDEIALAVEKRILFLTVESPAELELIEKVARRRGSVAGIAFRINPGVDPHTHRYITTGAAENKFGLDLGSALEAYNKSLRMKHLLPIAIQMHIGSQITETAPYVRAIRKVRPLLQQLWARGINLRFFDIGGGMGIVYRKERPSTAESFAAAILPELKSLDLHLILEPGRFIAGNAGILLTKVLYVKKGAVKNFVIVDAGMNDLIRPSLYGAYHEILPIRRRRAARMHADIVGPVCESGDFLGLDRTLTRPVAGDLLAVMGAGAYGFTMSSNYNSRRRAAELLVHGKGVDLIRARESSEDLMRGESIPAFLR